ncbi:hypothetical protein D9619_005160 [Psilocybe cf. subviscida]|uniref:SAP domain-containing protein n=1 Tax=Psilocybe cf. subviscida TaxID=2480587 RepID=A0A8H5BPQ1_9AGAR|nr:hypothetical protein D9619_005160 [Psilocybe cf. subviscida]
MRSPRPRFGCDPGARRPLNGAQGLRLCCCCCCSISTTLPTLGAITATAEALTTFGTPDRGVSLVVAPNERTLIPAYSFVAVLVTLTLLPFALGFLVGYWYPHPFSRTNSRIRWNTMDYTNSDTMDVDTETTVLSPPKKQQQWDRLLPFPSLVDGKIGEQTLNINTHVSTLRDWCRSSGLHVTGAKSILQERLEEFSGDRECWKTFEPKKRRSQRGPRDGGIAKKKKGTKSTLTKDATEETEDSTDIHASRSRPVKQSALRAAEVFAKREPQALAHMPLPLPSQIPLQTNEERAHIMDWARLGLELYPYMSKADRVKAAQNRAQNTRVPLGSAGNLENLQSIVKAGVMSGIAASTSTSALVTQPMQPFVGNVESALQSR